MPNAHFNAMWIDLIGSQAFSTENVTILKNARIMDTHIPIRLEREIG